MSLTGVYEIVCLVHGKKYIGSSRRVNRRWAAHRYRLRHAKHHSPMLQHAWSKYGESAFAFRVIEECAAEDLVAREQFHIDAMQPVYNVMKTAFAMCLGVRAKAVASLRARAALITHCPQGHGYTLENTRMRGGARICRACNAARSNAANMSPEKRERRLEQRRQSRREKAACL